MGKCDDCEKNHENLICVDPIYGCSFCYSWDLCEKCAIEHYKGIIEICENEIKKYRVT
jgi:hypothetical protein